MTTANPTNKDTDSGSADAQENRTTQARQLVILACVGVPVTLAVCWYLDITLAMVGLSALFAIGGIVSLRASGRIARIGASQALIGQAIVLNASLAGFSWQIDMHMLYFALLAVTIVLYDIPAILSATALIALHHLTLTLFMPSLVFPSVGLAENLPRTLLHAVIVLIETGALVFAVMHRKKLDAQTARQNDELIASNADAEAAQSRAEALLVEAEQAKSDAERAKVDAEAALERAEAESLRAAESEQAAREADSRETANRQETADRQKRIVDELRRSLRALRDRDLGVEISENVPEEYADLREDFNSAVTALREAILLVQDGADLIGCEANSVAEASQQMSIRTERQAATLADISSKLSSLSDSVTSSARSARDAESDAGNTQSEVEASGNLVRQAVSAMSGIEESSEQISKIVSVIDEISFQTNLLALNAGVEAARAGDSGRGFAVVASEVRNLAMRSSDAAQEIKTLIQKSDSRVREGVGLVRQTGKANESVMSAVHGIVQSVISIAESSEAQASALGEINASLSTLDNVTQKSVAAFEETSAASQVLLDGTRKLTESVTQFTATGPGIGKGVAASAA